MRNGSSVYRTEMLRFLNLCNDWAHGPLNGRNILLDVHCGRYQCTIQKNVFSRGLDGHLSSSCQRAVDTRIPIALMVTIPAKVAQWQFDAFLLQHCW
jgi:hypothetical protein